MVLFSLVIFLLAFSGVANHHANNDDFFISPLNVVLFNLLGVDGLSGAIATQQVLDSETSNIHFSDNIFSTLDKMSMNGVIIENLNIKDDEFSLPENIQRLYRYNTIKIAKKTETLGCGEHHWKNIDYLNVHDQVDCSQISAERNHFPQDHGLVQDATCRINIENGGNKRSPSDVYIDTAISQLRASGADNPFFLSINIQRDEIENYVRTGCGELELKNTYQPCQVMSLVDRSVSTLMQYLKSTRQWDNTVFLFLPHHQAITPQPSKFPIGHYPFLGAGAVEHVLRTKTLAPFISKAFIELHSLVSDLCTGQNINVIVDFLHRFTPSIKEAGDLTELLENTDTVEDGGGETDRHVIGSRSLATSSYQTLSVLYASTIGASWTRRYLWMNGSDPCVNGGWYGVTCASSVITALSLSSNNLEGSLPSQIGQLTGLTSSLDLDRNSFSGSLPSQIGQLTGLKSALSVYSNRFSGPLPSQIGQLTVLSSSLNLYSNRFSSMPTQIGQLAGLTLYFQIYANSFSGSLPSQIGLLTGMKSYFKIYSNSFSGSLPSQLGLLTRMTSQFYLYSNSFTGSLPSQIGQFTGLTSSLDLNRNSFNGSLPSQIGQLTAMKSSFFAYSNRFSGSLPSQFGRLTAMETYFYLFSNHLTGLLPSELGQLTEMTNNFQINFNSFTGSLPSELGLLTFLTFNFEVHSNQFSGSLPSQLGQLTGFLLSINLNSNSFSGSLPSQLGKLTKMKWSFNIYSNSFTGLLPSQLGQLSGMSSNFNIYSNSFTGLLPSQLGLLTLLSYNFRISNNEFCDAMPSEVVAISSRIDSTANSLGTPCCYSLPLQYTCTPTSGPTTSFTPTILPTIFSFTPTISPSLSPTALPTYVPTIYPTKQPTLLPSFLPTTLPSGIPTPLPTAAPTFYCEPGTYLLDTLTCTKCPIGFYSNKEHPPFPTSCELCPAGQYNTASGSSGCTNCATGKLSSADRTFCADCKAGQYIYNYTQCISCEYGKYAPQALTGSCLTCLNGSHTNNQTKATTCTPCDAGKYARYLSVECSTCVKGKFSSNGASHCTNCASGTYAAEGGSPICTACSAGNFTSTVGSIVCAECQLGKYQGSTGQSSCINCEAGKRAGSRGLPSCADCDTAYDSSTGAESCDKAKIDYYLSNNVNDNIISDPCPRHAQCFGGYQLPVPDDDYWVDRSLYKYAGVIHKCSRATCVQNTKLSNSSCWDSNQFANPTTNADCDSDYLLCSEGATGPLCGSCLDGYVLQSVTNSCEQCGEIQFVAYIALGAVIVLCLLGFVYVKMGDPIGVFQFQLIQYIVNFDHGSLKVLWVTYQIIATSSYTIGIEFPSPFSTLLGHFSLFSFDFLALRCFSSGNSAYYATVVLWCLVPITLCGFIVFVGFIRYKLKRSHSHQINVKNEHIWMVLLLSYLVLPPVSNKQLQVFDCIKVSNHRYLRSDTSVDCESETYLSFRRVVFLFTVIYQLIPIIWMYLLFQKKEALNPNTSSYDTRLAMFIRDNNDELASLRFLFVDYTCNKWWFEITDMYRRIVFLGIIPLVSPNPATRASFGCILAILSVAYYREEQPYRVEFTNVIAHIAQFCILITFYGAMTIETNSMMNFGLKNQKLGVFLLSLNLIIAVLAFWLAYSSFYEAKTKKDLKELKASTSEDARSFSKNKFETTFDAIWKHSVPASHTLVFHYTSSQLAASARKSGILAQKRFNGIPFTLRHPYKITDADFDIFDLSFGQSEIQHKSNKNIARRRFPHEEVLVFSLPKHFLAPLLGYEEDDGLCMISAQILHAMRSTSFTAVVDNQPWVNGFALLPPQCILRSFLIMDKLSTASQRYLSLPRDIYGHIQRKGSSRREKSFESFVETKNSLHSKQSFRDQIHTEWSNPLSPVIDVTFQVPVASLHDNSPQLTDLNSIDNYIQTMRKLRQKAFANSLTLLYHYTSTVVATLILQTGLRMSTQGQGDGGVYVSTLGPASYGLGTDDYEINIIKDCFGVERIEEYEGKGKLDVIIVYACEPSVLQQAPGGRDNAKMFSKATFIDFSLQHNNGSFFLRPDRIFAAFHVNSKRPLMSQDSIPMIKVEYHREQEVNDKLRFVEMRYQENANRIEKAVTSLWNSIHELKGSKEVQESIDITDEVEDDIELKVVNSPLKTLTTSSSDSTADEECCIGTTLNPLSSQNTRVPTAYL